MQSEFKGSILIANRYLNILCCQNGLKNSFELDQYLRFEIISLVSVDLSMKKSRDSPVLGVQSRAQSNLESVKSDLSFFYDLLDYSRGNNPIYRIEPDDFSQRCWQEVKFLMGVS